MNALYTANALMRHLWNANHWRSFHSPFLFRLFTYCSTAAPEDARFMAIESRRRTLLQSKELIDRNDLGAGSIAGSNHTQQPVKEIARHALSPPMQCRFLAHMCHFIEASTILELGTSLGITTAYLKTANPEANITTIEGDTSIATIAKNNWQSLGLTGITTHTTSFEQYLESDAFRQTTWDLVFIDGNHRSNAVLTYYNQIKTHIASTSVMVIDDIYWSPDMQSGWQALIHQPEVTQSVDCFRFGLLFFNADFLAKEHHRVILL